MKPESIVPYGPVLIKLLQGIIYEDEKSIWDMLLTFQTPITEYFERIGLDVIIDESEGFGYLSQPDIEDEEIKLPRLTRRIKLTYNETLLCVLLREHLQQNDAKNIYNERVILSKDSIRDLMRFFLKERSDETKILATLDATIMKVVNLGFLKEIRGDDDTHYEIRRILKAKIQADKLSEIKERLQSYVQ